MKWLALSIWLYLCALAMLVAYVTKPVERENVHPIFVPRDTVLITATASAPTFVPITAKKRGNDYVLRANLWCLVLHGERIVNHCLPPYYGPQY